MVGAFGVRVARPATPAQNVPRTGEEPTSIKTTRPLVSFAIGPSSLRFLRPLPEIVAAVATTILAEIP